MTLTAASGPISVAQDTLGTTLAHAAAFQAWVEAEDADEAAERIYHFTLPDPRSEDGEYTREELEAYRPYAVLFTAAREGFRYDLDAVGESGFEFKGSGRLEIRLVQNAPFGVTEPNAEADRRFKNAVGDIIADLCGLAGNGGYLAFSSIRLQEGPYWPSSTLVHSQGLWQAAEIALDWGTP
jgi:hypothetical protein